MTQNLQKQQRHAETGNQDSELTTRQVENYLQQHPEFFEKHIELLEDLSIPHPSGTAVSLISKQLELIRNRHHDLENELTALIEIARENDALFNRMHQLTLALLDASSLEETIENLDKVLTECFLTDFVSVKIFQDNPDSPIANLFISPDDENIKLFSRDLSENRPRCGRPTLEQARFLFQESALEVQSFAIIPMMFSNFEGLIAIGSREKRRFHYSLGNLFLVQISEIVGTRLISLIHKA